MVFQMKMEGWGRPRKMRFAWARSPRSEMAQKATILPAA